MLCQFLVLAGNRQFFCCSGKKVLVEKKKVPVICLAGAQSLLRQGKKVLVVCLAGARSLLRPEKKVLVVIFVLVLAIIDLIHVEHSICISST